MKSYKEYTGVTALTKVKCTECEEIFNEGEVLIDFTTQSEVCPCCKRYNCLEDLS